MVGTSIFILNLVLFHYNGHLIPLDFMCFGFVFCDLIFEHHVQSMMTKHSNFKIFEVLRVYGKVTFQYFCLFRGVAGGLVTPQLLIFLIFIGWRPLFPFIDLYMWNKNHQSEFSLIISVSDIQGFSHHQRSPIFGVWKVGAPAHSSSRDFLSFHTDFRNTTYLIVEKTSSIMTYFWNKMLLSA